MNGNDQETRCAAQEDLLEQIITQGLEKMKTPPLAEEGPESPGSEAPSVSVQESGGEAAAPPDQKHRQSAVYLYLLVLFGAAFLMLLLAYFVQRRSSEDAISDLHNSMNLSREELLDEIRALEEENEALSGEVDRLNDELSHWEGYREESMESIDLWRQLYEDSLDDLRAWAYFWELEQYYQAGDFEKCAGSLLLQTMSQSPYHTPDAAQERYEEIIRAVIDAGILAEDYAAHVSDYEELMDAYLADRTVYSGSVGC